MFSSSVLFALLPVNNASLVIQRGTNLAHALPLLLANYRENRMLNRPFSPSETVPRLQAECRLYPGTA